MPPDDTQPGALPRLAYRLLTGADDRAFCERISTALADGYVLYGSPSVVVRGGSIVCAQAVVLPQVFDEALKGAEGGEGASR